MCRQILAKSSSTSKISAASPGKVAFLKRLVEYYEGPLPANSVSDSSVRSVLSPLLDHFMRWSVVSLLAICNKKNTSH